MKNNRPKRRCPDCGSTNIYKRSRDSIISSKCKKVYKEKIYVCTQGCVQNGENGGIKKYRCVSCKKEFDSPLIQCDRDW